ncbi:MFS transporter [Pyrobaculum neutrophilum]|uniref:CBS domain containing protein n=1 Tax=Pyrobaculum neutrophilum (strain DSM 2338 / JCM 9278 / NBRC 100436 / V24Sta) TaxID=444157 RepID=B1YBF9_PYRNV|nr:MFS transporter [Pyrobaculum neutrophilum]ACB40761.1 CBS domain containing protein [Pyrobaculum neutrophilum V24Sta]
MTTVYTFRQLVSVAGISWLGAFLEWLDFYTFATLAPLISGKFFPSKDPIAALLSTFAALAIGFLFRPLGAILFGKIGDQYGRKIAFTLAMTLMLAGTLGIGLLPTYDQIGILASIGVFVLRIIQGLALGGGFGAALVYLGEFAPEHRRGFITGFLFTTAPAGMGTAALLQVIIASMVGKETFGQWGWRINFIVAGVIVFVVALVIHFFYKETPIFSMLKAVRRVTSAPVREVFSGKYLPLVLLAWIGVVGAHGPVWYTNQLFNSYYVSTFQKYVDGSTANALLSTATYAALWMYPLFGYLSDKIGRKPILLLGIFGNALWFPIAFWLIDKVGPQKDLTAMWLLFWSMTLFNGIGYSGAMSAYLLELFPARIRLSAVSLSYNLGYGVTGGLTPTIITALYQATHNIYLSTILWSTLVPVLMGLVFLFKGWETLGTRIWAELAAGKFAKKAVVLPPTAPIRAAAQKMAEGVRAVVIAASKPVGVFGRRQLIRALASGATPEAEVGRFATRVDCVGEDAPLTEVFAAMEKYGVRDVPICKGDEVVGIIEARELLNEALALRGIVNKKKALSVSAGDAVARDPITVPPSATLRDVLKIMAEKNIGFVPVVEDGRLVGGISESDFVQILLNNTPLDTPVEKVMRCQLITIERTRPVKEAAELMVKHNIRHLPVVEDGKVVGVLSVRDLLKAVA